MKKIALGVTSSISIYKACEILRGFQNKDVQVQVVMTRNAARLISPRLFSSLSGRTAIVELFGDEDTDRIAHISLAEDISLLVVAPATANIIAKFASGVADDFLSTFYLAVRRPVLIAPAMNQAMYLHPQTQANIRGLRSAGVEFILPERGYLACREEGWGRLAPVEAIVDRGVQLLDKCESLKGRRILVTAGPTREPLDPVRFLSNRSSGKMGYELAAEAAWRGADVFLVSGPTALDPPFGVERTMVETAAEMHAEVEAKFPRADAVIMAAAVSDFRPALMAGQKIKKAKAPRKINLVRTEDILEILSRSRSRKRKVIVGFAAETENIIDNARRKLEEKKLDLIAANDVSGEGSGFESDFNQVTLIDSAGVILETGKLSKREVSRVILDQVEVLLGQKK
jgi:phosphopantothenoylcysteine decarboxylase/phosphopantothenate--cysteine ligase